MAAVFLRVTGKVQGVFFRRSTLEKAQELGLKGWVRNTEDYVEVHAEGPEEALELLTDWCHQGPEMAEVEAVGVAQCDEEGFEEFEIQGK